MVRISRIAAGSGSRQASSGWWSQRDLNPCLSLERTEGTEQNQSDDDSESSDE
mgnify:CR=1 FL=1